MTIRARGLRAAIAGLAVFALAFHALVMGLGTVPKTGAEQALLTALAEICSATAQHGDADPSGPDVPAPSHKVPVPFAASAMPVSISRR